VAEQTLNERARAGVLLAEKAVLGAEVVCLLDLDGDFAFELANVLCSLLVMIVIVVEGVLTLSSRAEGAGRHLIAELTAFF
jgi:hypothetical protein